MLLIFNHYKIIIEMGIQQLAETTKKASIKLAAINTIAKNNALAAIAKKLNNNRTAIIEANNTDIAEAEKNNLEAPLLKRLKFDNSKIDDTITGIESLIKLADPVGATIKATELYDGMELYQVSCPIGVIGVVFESRPDALVQISTLCLKSGNGVLLKGGSEALHTNRILTKLIGEATSETGIPEGWAQLLETRSDVNEMLKADKYIDLIIPRGSNEFVQYIMNNSNIPVLGHADGICHSYVDTDADIDAAVKIAVDSKTQYVAVCNALETLLVHEKIAKEFLPKFKTAVEAKGATLKGCVKTTEIINIEPATDEDWRTEYLDYILSIKIVVDMQEAIDHIHQYGSGHTDAILTDNESTAAYFIQNVDTGNVFWNCSTRFSDGFRYGLGAEVGVSTNKIHARGPVGLEGLMIYKWVMKGNKQIVADFAEGKKQFTHKPLDKRFKI